MAMVVEDSDDDVVVVVPSLEEVPSILTVATDHLGNPLPLRGRPREHPLRFSCSTSDPFSNIRDGYFYFVIRGRPKAKPRPGIAGNGRRYNAAAHLERDFCQTLRRLLQNKLESIPPPSNDPIKLTVRSYFPGPATSLVRLGDTPNLANFVMDSLQGFLFHDDGQVVDLRAVKGFDDSYGGQGYTVVQLKCL